MRTHSLLLASLVLAVGSFSHAAEVYPSHPITMVLPFAAGGQTDAIARTIAEPMKAVLGQPIIMENISGAGGTIGMARVARAAPDGHTLILGSQSQFVNSGAVYALPFDLVKDFEPIALIANSPSLLLARSTMTAHDLEALIVWIKANHAKVSQGHVGAGSGPHLCGIDMQNRVGTRWIFVPYRGGSAAMQDLVGGQIDVYCTSPGTSIAMVRSGLVKAYAVAGKSRLPAAPNIPTVDEAGLPGLHVATWHGLWAPKRTPKAIVARLNAAVTTALADAAIGARFADIGLDIPPSVEQTPEALGAFQRAEINKWWPIIKAAGIKAD
jgi:tripartite-type tricarboxylate transporter receptor subunit TctC